MLTKFLTAFCLMLVVGALFVRGWWLSRWP